MNDDLRMLVLDALNDEDEIRLLVGENEFFIDRPDYSIAVEYCLESFEDFYSNDDDCSLVGRYAFTLINVLLSTLDDDVEHYINTDEEIRSTIIDNAVIDNWSGSLICLRDVLV